MNALDVMAAPYNCIPGLIVHVAKCATCQADLAKQSPELRCARLGALLASFLSATLAAAIFTASCSEFKVLSSAEVTAKKVRDA